MNGIKVKFWGVRGSFPIPKSEDAFGGNTSCIEIRTSSNELVVLDMGTGLKNLGNSLIKSKNPITDINIVLSHFHYDHILGFLMFMPLFDEKYTINIYAPGESDNEVESIFKSFFNSDFWPVDTAMLSANINFRHYSSGSFNLSNKFLIKFHKFSSF